MKKLFGIFNILLLIILIPVLIVSLLFIAKSYIDKENVPSILGYSPLIVLAGSMESAIYTGDLIVVKETKTEDLNEGDVIAFYTDNSKGIIVTHRIIDIVKDTTQTSFITKGDNNNAQDLGKVPSNLIVGKYAGIRVKGLGNAAVFLQTPTGMCIVISIPILILMIAQYVRNRQDKKELEELRRQNKTK